MADLKPVEYYLREYALSKVQIVTLQAELDELLSMITDAQSTLSRVNKDKANSLTADVERLSAALLGEIDSITNRCEGIVAIIASLENPEMRVVFERRYLRRLAFWKIAKGLGISETKAKTLHKSGLIILKERYG